MSKKYTLRNVLTPESKGYLKEELLEVGRRTSAKIAVLIISKSSTWYRMGMKAIDVKNRTHREFELWRNDIQDKTYVFVMISLAENRFEICLSEDIKIKSIGSKAWEHAKENLGYGLKCNNPYLGINMAISAISDFLQKKFPRKLQKEDFKHEPESILMFKE